MNKPIIIGIYKITSPNGSIYIGQSINIYSRWSDYFNLDCDEQIRLYRSFKKHGVENHIFEIIHVLDLYDKEILDLLEIYYIKHFDCFDTPHGLNLKEGGSHGRASKETREKLSKSRIGKKQNPETVIKRVETIKKK